MHYTYHIQITSCTRVDENSCRARRARDGDSRCSVSPKRSRSCSGDGTAGQRSGSAGSNHQRKHAEVEVVPSVGSLSERREQTDRAARRAVHTCSSVGQSTKHRLLRQRPATAAPAAAATPRALRKRGTRKQADREARRRWRADVGSQSVVTRAGSTGSSRSRLAFKRNASGIDWYSEVSARVLPVPEVREVPRFWRFWGFWRFWRLQRFRSAEVPEVLGVLRVPKVLTSE